MIRSALAVVVAASFVSECRSATGADLTALIRARNTIVEPDLKSHVAVLADDTFEGRLAGSRGGRAAAGYLVERFRKFGLQPLGVNGSYTQPFDRECRNLLAVLPGSDPVLKDEYILIGAHYDHVGYGNARNSFGPFGYIHNGADDNASGVSALLELAESLTAAPLALKRSVIIVFWDSEEQGLFGSKHWLSRPTIDLGKLRAAVNVDMIGRLSGEGLHVIGSRTGYGYRNRIARANAETAVPLDFRWEILEDSDHHPFYRAGIPVVMFHTGKHGDYHRPSDDAEKLNYAGLQSVSRLVFDLVVELADGETTPTFRAASRTESGSERNRETFERPLGPPPGRFGIRWQPHGGSDDGLQVTYVQNPSPAARAGLQVGDRLLACDGAKLSSDDDLQRVILRSDQPVRMTIAPRSGGAAKDVMVTLDGAPVRVGVSWVPDEAEPGCVLVKAVLPSSPAEKAGLRAVDRIIALDGRQFSGGDEFETRLGAAQAKLSLTVERRGVLHEMELELAP